MGNGGPGITSGTSGNQDCYVDGDRIEVVEGNKNEWVNGTSIEFVNGTKTFEITGALAEVFVGTKLEGIWSDETKINIGGLAEVTVGFRREWNIGVFVELNRGPKYHICVPGQKRIISDDTLESLEDEMLVGQYKRHAGREYRKTIRRLEKIGSLRGQFGKVKQAATEIDSNATWMELQCGKIDLVCSTFTLDGGSALKIEAGSVDIETDGSLTLDGPVKIEGGGKTVEVGSGLKVNGFSLVVS